MRRPFAAFPLLVLLAGCASRKESAVEPESTPSDRKQRMLFATEHAIHQVRDDARKDIAKLRAEFDAAVDHAPRSYRIDTSDPVLQEYGSALRDARHVAVEQAQATSEERFRLLLEHYEQAMWDVAIEAGKLERGSGLGYRTGYQELDDKVESAILQLERDAAVEGMEQVATIREYDDVVLERWLREEVEGIGVVSLYKSAPTLDLFAPTQEGQAVVVSFARDEKVGKNVPLSFVQAARRVVERGGIVLTASPWRFDPATPGGKGVVPLHPGVDPATHVVSEICTPSVDVTAPGFQDLRDTVLVSEYRTAVRRDDTGELIATIGWQVRWNVDFRGTMRVLVDKSDLLLVNDPVLPGLLAAPAAAPTSTQ
jgi:hypothetical protein